MEWVRECEVYREMTQTTWWRDELEYERATFEDPRQKPQDTEAVRTVGE